MCDSTVHIKPNIPLPSKSTVLSIPFVPTSSDQVVPSISCQCNKMCVHDFIEDWIDIDPDRSQRIVYCRICEMTKK